MKKNKRKSNMQPPKNFTWIMRRIFLICLMIPRIGKFLANFYKKNWNFVNYAIIGGVGVLINYTLFAALIRYLPWYITNIVAILSAWLWNWSNSVGRTCEHWGYTRNE